MRAPSFSLRTKHSGPLLFPPLFSPTSLSKLSLIHHYLVSNFLYLCYFFSFPSRLSYYLFCGLQLFRPMPPIPTFKKWMN